MRTRWLFLALCLLLGAPTSVVCAQDLESAVDEEDGEPELLPGLVATYTDAAGRLARRVDAHVALHAADHSPDERVSLEGLDVEWRGQLLVLAPGQYRLHAFVAGHVTVEVDGRELFAGGAADGAWIDSPPVELAFGHHPLVVRYARSAAAPQLGLYWSGPQFTLEPIPEWHLFHDPGDSPGGRFDRGAALVHALRCGACHRDLARERVLRAPSLARLKGNVSPTWLARWIEAPSHRHAPGDARDAPIGSPAEAVSRRMPAFGLSRIEAESIAVYLLAVSDPTPPDVKKPTEPKQGDGAQRKDKQPASPNAETGATLFRTVGCLACHRVEALGRGGLFGGGDLSHVADKRPSEFFAAWLRDPAALNPAHRMPIFALDDEEIAHLAAYLSTLCESDAADHDVEIGADPALGKQLIERHRCAACHAMMEAFTSAQPAPIELPQGTPRTRPRIL